MGVEGDTRHRPLATGDFVVAGQKAPAAGAAESVAAAGAGVPGAAAHPASVPVPAPDPVPVPEQKARFLVFHGQSLQ